MRVGLVDIEHPDGHREDYHVVYLDPVAVALVVDEHQRVLMLGRYRFPVDQAGYELPGGLVERGETAAAAAARETLEETGWRPRGTPSICCGSSRSPANSAPRSTRSCGAAPNK